MKVKKIFLISFLLLSFFFLIPGQAWADLFPLVQCGVVANDACSFCDFFDVIGRIVQIIMLRIAPLVATLMLAIGGVMLLFAGADPHVLQTAKGIIKSTVIGLAVILTAFLIVGTILNAVGLAEWTHDFYKNWWSEGIFQIPGC